MTYSGAAQSNRFTSIYDASYERAATLAAIAGSYSGVAISSAGGESASFTVSSSGSISGVDASGCRFTGSASPRGAVAVYNLTVSFLGGICAQGSSTITGVAYLGENTNELVGAALNSARSDGVLFVGQKAGTTTGTIGNSQSSGGSTPTGSSTSTGSSASIGSSSGCGSRGGPGYRKANGDCASWADYYAGRR